MIILNFILRIDWEKIPDYIESPKIFYKIKVEK